MSVSSLTAWTWGAAVGLGIGEFVFHFPAMNAFTTLACWALFFIGVALWDEWRNPEPPTSWTTTYR